MWTISGPATPIGTNMHMQEEDLMITTVKVEHEEHIMVMESAEPESEKERCDF